MHTEYLHCHCAVLQPALQSDVYQLHQSPAVTDNTVPCSAHLHWYVVGMQIGQLSPNASELTPEFPVNPMRNVNAVRQGGVVISYVQKNHWRRLLNIICWHSRTNIPSLTSQMQDEWICSINIHCVHEKNGPKHVQKSSKLASFAQLKFNSMNNCLFSIKLPILVKICPTIIEIFTFNKWSKSLPFPEVCFLTYSPWS